MRVPIRAFLSFVVIAASISVSGAEVSAAEEVANPGKELAFARNKGNCLSCHLILDAELPGNSGPPLLQMKVRFPDREALRSQIWDASVKTPDTVMPPYGRHNILTEPEIDLVVDYVLSL